MADYLDGVANDSMFEAFFNFDELRISLVDMLQREMQWNPNPSYRTLFQMLSDPKCSEIKIYYAAKALNVNLDYYKSILPTISRRIMDLLNVEEDGIASCFIEQDMLDYFLSFYVQNVGFITKKDHENALVYFDFSTVDSYQIKWILDVASSIYDEFVKKGAANLEIAGENIKQKWSNVVLLNYDREPGKEDLWKKYIFIIYKMRDWLYHFNFVRYGKPYDEFDKYLLYFDIECLADNPSFVGEIKRIQFARNIDSELFSLDFFHNYVSLDFLKAWGDYFKLFSTGRYEETSQVLPKSVNDCKYLWQVYALTNKVGSNNYNVLLRLLKIDEQMYGSLKLLGIPEDKINYKMYYMASIYNYSDYIYIHDAKIKEEMEFAKIPMFKRLKINKMANNVQAEIQGLFNELASKYDAFVNRAGYMNGKNPNFNIINCFGPNGVLSLNSTLERLGRIKKIIVGTDMRNSNGHKNTELEEVDGQMIIRHRDISDMTATTFDKEYELPVDDYFSIIDTYARVQIGDRSFNYNKNDYLYDLLNLATFVPSKENEYLDIAAKYEEFFSKKSINGHSFYQELIIKLVEGLKQSKLYLGQTVDDETNELLANHILKHWDCISIIDVSRSLNPTTLDYSLVLNEDLYNAIIREKGIKKGGRYKLVN